MEDSVAQQPFRPVVELPAWKSVTASVSAIILGLLFIVAGVWKITDPLNAAARMMQARLPADWALPAAIGLGIAETAAGVLLFVPRFRRWGAYGTAVLLAVFMIYIGANYAELRGEECSCFPWIKRAVGPGFFLGDALMMVLAIVAAVWSRPPEGVRGALIIVASVCVFAGVSYGAIVTRQHGLRAPHTITVDGKPYSLDLGRHLLYFFDPECSHCFEAAKKLAALRWRDVRIIGVPTAQPRFTQDFLQDTGLRAGVSFDLDLLRRTFSFASAPYAVALENGRQVEALHNFEGAEPEATLRRIGFIE
jgi:uncharacterized membrane protein YphA (DoxX/SURF4 family)